MLNEKKTAVTEEVKEEVRKLTEEELAQVSGGGENDLGEFELKLVQGGSIISTLEPRIG